MLKLTSRPLFWLHGDICDSQDAALLASLLGPEFPLVELPSHRFEHPSLQTIEAVAAYAVRSIQKTQPSGCYRFVSSSSARFLAYEVATQLIASDSHVEFVGIIDNSAHDTTISAHRPTAPQLVVAQASTTLQHIGPDLTVCHRELSRVSNNELSAFASSVSAEELPEQCCKLPQYQRCPLSQPRSENIDVIDDEGRCRLADLTYCPQPLPAPIHIFYPGESGAENKRLAWNTIFPDAPLHLIAAPGSSKTMMQRPHVETVASTLAQLLDAASSKPRQLAEQTYSPIILLQSGQKEIEPLVCIPGAGANITVFSDLVAQMPSTVPCYGLQPRGLDGQLVPHSTVSAVTSSYLRAIDEVIPDVPIHLLGHSFGGWVAFEIAATLLSKRGHAIATLTIVDSDAPDCTDELVREYDDQDVLVQWITLFEQVLSRSLVKTCEQITTTPKAQRFEALHAWLASEGLISARSRPEVLAGPLRVFAMCLRSHYHPTGVYNGPTQLILLDDERIDRKSDRQKQEKAISTWKQYAPNLVFKKVPGNHMTVLRKPDVSFLAMLLRDLYRY
jgi:thioesterase domain-containing protein